jgi:hypothetical protein
MLVAVSALAQQQFKVTYNGGSIREIKAGAKISVIVSADSLRIEKPGYVIPTSDVDVISYSDEPRRMFVPNIGVPGVGMYGGSAISAGVNVLSMLSRTPKHFVGVQWGSRSMVLQAGSSDWRNLLAAIEAASNRPAIYVR